MAAKVKCTRSGCGQLFSPLDNNASNCRHHVGGPVFHEGGKSWSCCNTVNKPVTSFDEFMAIPGCTWGSHSAQAVAQAPVLSEQQQRIRDMSLDHAPKPIATPVAPTKTPALDIPPRPDYHAHLVAAPSKEKENTPFPVEKDVDQDPEGFVPEQGAKCKRLACGASYNGSAEAKADECSFHPGVPIFHEGSKGYSCCKPRVLEFDQFLSLPGCARNRHLFVGTKQKPVEENQTLRVDHYQTPTQVIVSIFGKGADKQKSTITFEHWELEYDLHLPNGKRGFKKLVSSFTAQRLMQPLSHPQPLFGPIDPAKSSYRILSTKAEVILQKADGRSWPALEHSLDEKQAQLTFGVPKA